ncbi:hypothetical protein PBAL39_21395 [Pedobacter sp. BAL39]|uniref:vWA domain-containing protein n=1 Tax=Pedobacter sp. BAL39 TaxID=391596 RepID=UPI0001559C6D|nr:BatA and WFA domain-containing protein [Pedobacter sp. BAL39]EDM38670.1 hypothetical protein PBAL39_21395 [Pedobacter sp. BAL39]
MNFLYPGFLFALLAIAIPIAIHLFNFRKFKKIYFSNVQFLKAATEQNSSREKLKHRMVLVCRILAVAFLVMAFARPYLPLDHRTNVGQRNMVSIYIDNSYSMETVNQEGSLLDEALRKAKEIVAAYPLNDQFQLITNDFEGKHQRLVNKEEFLQLLEEVKISAAGRTLQQVVNRMQGAAAANGNQIAYLLSDFQQSFAGTEKITTGNDIRYTLIKLNANPQPNIAVDSIWSLSPVHQPNQPEQLVVKLHNYGEEDAADVPLRLTLNGQQKALSNAKVDAGKTVNDTLSFAGLQRGWQKGILQIKDFPLTFDDAMNFSFEVNTSMKVLNITGNAVQNFIPSLYAADPYFKLTEMPEENIQYSTLPEYQLIILSGIKEPGSGLAEQLKGYLQNGGSVVIFPNLDANANAYSAFLNALSLPSIRQLNVGTGIGSSIDLKHPLFKDVFDQIPANMDLPLVKRHFSFEVQNQKARTDILKLPLNEFLFAQYGLGSGKIYLSAVSLDPKDSNLGRHPVFVPMMFKIAFSSLKAPPLYYTTGKSSTLEIPKVNLGNNQTLILKADAVEVIPDVRQTPDQTLLYIADQVRQSGFYDLRKADSLLAVVAFNDNRLESDMHYASEDNMKALFDSKQLSVYNSKKDALSMNIQAKNNSIELWKLSLILAVVFLALEILLIRFFNNSKNIQTS